MDISGRVGGLSRLKHFNRLLPIAVCLVVVNASVEAHGSDGSEIGFVENYEIRPCARFRQWLPPEREPIVGVAAFGRCLQATTASGKSYVLTQRKSWEALTECECLPQDCAAVPKVAVTGQVESVCKRFKGVPTWDGTSKMAFADREARTITMVDIADAANPRILWQERIKGIPGQTTFWKGWLVIPGGLSGVLLEQDMSYLAEVDGAERAEYTPQAMALPRQRGIMSPSKRMTEDDFNTLGDWGVKLLRYQMMRSWGELNVNADLDDYHAWLKKKLDHLEEFVLPQAAKRGIRVVIDLHSPPGGRRKSKEMRMFFESEYAEEFIRTWEMIARRFKGNPNVFAYDLVNEPKQVSKSPKGCDYWNLQCRAARAIRAIDAETLIAVESNYNDCYQTFSYLKPLPVSNVVYQVHMYEPMQFSHQGIGSLKNEKGNVYPNPPKGWNKDYLREKLSDVRNFQLKYHARIYVGEFSACAAAEGADRYLRDLMEIFEEYGWDWSYHAFRESKCWSLEHDATGKRAPNNQRKAAVLEFLR